MIKATTIVRRIYVRQRAARRHHILIALSQSVNGEQDTPNRSVVSSIPRRVQQCSLRPSSSVATNSTDKHSVPSSDSLNNLPQNIGNDENSSNFPTKFIDFTAASKIEGEESHIATVTLHPGEVLRAESGSMIYMTDGVVCKYS